MGFLKLQMMNLLGTVKSVLTGRAIPYTRPGSFSAIDKKPIVGPVQVHREGLVGDEQGDRKVHGGLDKAVHFYAYEHYSFWRSELGEKSLLEVPGAFGENISTEGVAENDLCLGDQLLIGTVLLEISQTRQPCWKLNDRFGVQDMALRVQQSLRTGFYCRVLQTGTLKAGDLIYLMARPYPDWSIQRLMALLYRRTLDKELLIQALGLPLVPSWRKLIENRLSTGQVENWDGRIAGYKNNYE